MSDESPVLQEIGDDGVLLVTLNRPHKKNAFNEAQWDRLASTLDEAREDPRVAVAVIVLLLGGGLWGLVSGRLAPASEPDASEIILRRDPVRALADETAASPP